MRITHLLIAGAASLLLAAPSFAVEDTHPPAGEFHKEMKDKRMAHREEMMDARKEHHSEMMKRHQAMKEKR
jgi:hypothetical protein